MSGTHVPVLVSEVLEALAVSPGGRYIDGTAGGGGHAEAMLKASAPGGRVLALDRDGDAVERVRERLAPWGDRAKVVQGDFAEMRRHARAAGWEPANGVLLDLGMSSFQVDDAERGFSFLRDGPLDMRMNRTAGRTAAEWVNGASVVELTHILRDFGEEPAARRIAESIGARREKQPFRSTVELAEWVAEVTGGRRGRIHPATRTFQALRMAVNDELGQLGRGLEEALAVVRPGGRVAVISFHSLEDRLVKRTFGDHVGQWESLQEGGRRRQAKAPPARWVRRKPWVPGEAEVEANPRARSAKLRAVEREEETMAA